MRTLFIAASAIAMVSATPAFASDGEVAVKATVGEACGVGNHRSGASANPLWDQTDINVNLADGNGQFAGETFNNRSFGNVWCNAPAKVQIEVGSLVNGTRGVAPADSGSFRSEFDLIVTTNAGVYTGSGTGLVLDTALASNGVASTPLFTTAGAFETGLGQYSGFSVQVVNPGNLRPVAGTYAGYVKFTASIS